MNSPQATVILKSPDGSWTTVGTEASRGIVPEGITVSANDLGPDTCSFTLRRQASVPWPDLLAFNQADVLIGGTLVWGGRIWEAPLSDSDDQVIGVQGRGWQYHLDDDVLLRSYVLTDMGRYADQRSKPTAQLAICKAGGMVQAQGGALVLQFPKGFVVATTDTVGATLDLGSSLIEKVVVNWTRQGAADAGDTFFSRTSTDEDIHSAAATIDDTSSTLASASGTLTLTPAAGRRYHHLFVYRNGVGGTYAQDQGVRITSINVFSDAAYESGGASVLKASQVVTDVLASGALPLLDTSTAGIGTTAFSIPELAPSGYQTPRALMAAANAYEGNLFGVDAERRVFYRERDTYPSVEVGSWPGSSFQDASTNSGEGLYNKVIVQGTGPDGSSISTARFSSDVASAPASAFSDLGGVSNPGFETNLTGWTSTYGTAARVTGTDGGGNVFSAGTASAKLTGNAGGRSALACTLTGLTVGATHAVRFQYRVVGTGYAYGQGAQMAGAVSSGTTELGRTVDDSPTNSFEQIQVSFVATATTATFTATADGGPGIGTIDLVYIDDVHVYKFSASLLGRQGFARTATLSVDAAITNTGATELGDIWLNERTDPPLKGSLVLQGWGGARYVNGGDVHPSEMMLRYGQLVRLGQLADPATGDQGRDGIIKAVSYAHDTETATLELDSERGRLETLLSRLAIVTSQVRI